MDVGETPIHRNQRGESGGCAMIRLNDVSKIYQVGDQEVRALDRASLEIAEGEFVSIVGPSGSGKTTMMNIIGCLDRADEGEYYLDGLLIDQYSESDIARIRNRKIGFIFQGFNLLSLLTAEGNVELPLVYQHVGKAERRKRSAEALKRVGLYERRMHKPQELSGGEQQRVAIARALVTNPSLLLADEPTGNLDTKTGAGIMELFHDLHKSGNTIVLITHNPDIANQADRRINILDGKVFEEEPA